VTADEAADMASLPQVVKKKMIFFSKILNDVRAGRVLRNFLEPSVEGYFPRGAAEKKKNARWLERV
jgi:hypothetical protein